MFAFPTSVGHGTIRERETTASTEYREVCTRPDTELIEMRCSVPGAGQTGCQIIVALRESRPQFPQGQAMPVQRMSLPLHSWDGILPPVGASESAGDAHVRRVKPRGNHQPSDGYKVGRRIFPGLGSDKSVVLPGPTSAWSWRVRYRRTQDTSPIAIAEYPTTDSVRRPV